MTSRSTIQTSRENRAEDLDPVDCIKSTPARSLVPVIPRVFWGFLSERYLYHDGNSQSPARAGMTQLSYAYQKVERRPFEIDQ